MQKRWNAAFASERKENTRTTFEVVHVFGLFEYDGKHAPEMKADRLTNMPRKLGVVTLRGTGLPS